MKQLTKDELIHKILTRQHVTSRHCDEIYDISQPLRDIIPINYFNYARYYWQPGIPSFTFCDRFDVIEYYFRINGYIYNQDVLPIIFPGLHFMDNYKKNVTLQTKPRSIHRLIKLLEDDLDISHTVTMTFVCAGYLEVFTFGFPTATQNTYSLILNNKPSLKKFTIYFRDRARHLIKEAKKNKISRILLMKNYLDTLSFENLKSLHGPSQTVVDKKLKPKRYYLDGRYDDVYLTPREAQCAFLLKTYDSYQELANRLNLSYATVREHIDAIKTKLHCSNKTELLNTIRRTDLLNFIDDSVILSSMHHSFKDQKPVGFQAVDDTMDIFQKENDS